MGFFAVYNPSLTTRQETLENYPRIQDIFAPIAERLDNEAFA